MRRDETGNECPSTLGEYRRLCAAIGGHDCAAVKFLDQKISKSPHGANEKVITSDHNMRYLLMPLLITTELPQEENHE